MTKISVDKDFLNKVLKQVDDNTKKIDNLIGIKKNLPAIQFPLGGNIASHYAITFKSVPRDKQVETTTSFLGKLDSLLRTYNVVEFEYKMGK